MRNLSKIKRILALLFVSVFLFANLSVVVVAANPATPETILPNATNFEGTKALTTQQCLSVMSTINMGNDGTQAVNFQELFGKHYKSFFVNNDVGEIPANAVLGCAIKTGDIPLWMVPFFIRYILEFIIGISGLICVGGIVYGGFTYMFAGLGEDKEKGKKAIMYGIAGMVMSMLAWAFVNIVMAIVTI